MPQGWAKPFYSSTLWKNKRREVLRRDRYTCELCHARGNEVHHEVELTPANIHDPNVTLNDRLLHTLCHRCHTRITLGIGQDCGEGLCFDEEGQLVPMRGE